MSIISNLNTTLTNKFNALINAINQRRKISDSYSISETNLLLDSKLDIIDIIDSLLDESTNKALSANQGKILKELIDNYINSLSGITPGTVIISAISTAPTGFLFCDGSELDRTIYSNLFNAIGTNFGAGNGTTTFKIPDTRGVFIRSTGTSSGYASNVTINLAQKLDDAVQTHQHTYSDYYQYISDNSGIGPIGLGPYYITAGATIYPTSNSNNGRSANETRVKSIGLNHFIKY